MSLSAEAMVVGFLGRSPVPQKLTDIVKGMSKDGVSRSTLHRVLQRLVSEGAIERDGDRYFLPSKGRSMIKATDLARLSELEPAFQENSKGLRVRAYTTGNLKEVNWQSLKAPVQTAVRDILTQIDPVLSDVLDASTSSDKAIQKLVGLRFAVIISFDGTDFTTLSVEEILDKRKDAMRFLAVKKRATLEEMADELQLNILQVRQLLHPLLASGYAVIDDEDYVSYTLDVTPD